MNCVTVRVLSLGSGLKEIRSCFSPLLNTPLSEHGSNIDLLRLGFIHINQPENVCDRNLFISSIHMLKMHSDSADILFTIQPSRMF